MICSIHVIMLYLIVLFTRLYLKRCKGGTGLVTAQDYVLSECSGLWDYLEELE